MKTELSHISVFGCRDTMVTKEVNNSNFIKEGDVQFINNSDLGGDLEELPTIFGRATDYSEGRERLPERASRQTVPG